MWRPSSLSQIVPSCHVYLLVDTPNLPHLVSGLGVPQDTRDRNFGTFQGWDLPGLGLSMAGTFHGLPGTVHGSPGTDLQKYICLDISLFVYLFICLFVCFVVCLCFCYLCVCLFVFPPFCKVQPSMLRFDCNPNPRFNVHHKIYLYEIS